MSLENSGGNIQKDPKRLPETEVVGVEGAQTIQGNIITLPEIAELEEPTKRIIEQLRARIEKGEYGLIIGDDASGRVPALILWNFLNRIYKLRDVRGAKIVFIPGGLRDDSLGYGAILENYILKLEVTKKDRILLTTEAISSGGSIKILSSLLQQSGFLIDIATIGMYGSTEESMHSEYVKQKLGVDDIFSGDYHGTGINLNSAFTPKVFYNKAMSGMQKEGGGNKIRTNNF